MRRRDPDFADTLAAWYAQIVARERGLPFLPVDRAVAEWADDLRAARDTPYNDSLIAATALVHDLTLATRNTSGFEGTGIRLVNPWEFGGRVGLMAEATRLSRCDEFFTPGCRRPHFRARR